MSDKNTNIVYKKYKKYEKFSDIISKDEYREFIKGFTVSENLEKFIKSIDLEMKMNKSLNECNPYSLIWAVLSLESLKLPYSFEYFKFTKSEEILETTKSGKIMKDKRVKLQLTYKGYIQLAIKSGEYKNITASALKKGEFKSYNYITEELEISPIEDYEIRKTLPTVGYFAKFVAKNGFTKTIYWNYEKLLDFADKYVCGFSKEIYQKLKKGEIRYKKMFTAASEWYENFDYMACGTMLEQLLSEWGIIC